MGRSCLEELGRGEREMDRVCGGGWGGGAGERAAGGAEVKAMARAEGAGLEADGEAPGMAVVACRGGRRSEEWWGHAAAGVARWLLALSMIMASLLRATPSTWKIWFCGLGRF